MTGESEGEEKILQNEKLARLRIRRLFKKIIVHGDKAIFLFSAVFLSDIFFPSFFRRLAIIGPGVAFPVKFRRVLISPRSKMTGEEEERKMASNSRVRRQIVVAVSDFFCVKNNNRVFTQTFFSPRDDGKWKWG